MEPITQYLEQVTEGLLRDTVQLWQLPSAVSALYYLGEDSARRILEPQLVQAQADRDRYYRAASRGGFEAQIKPQGLSFAQLCRERGDHITADRVEADMASLSFNVGVLR